MNVLEKIIAVVDGKDFTTLPDDLYIPPDALEIFLVTFSGPLDLLLYFICFFLLFYKGSGADFFFVQLGL